MIGPEHEDRGPVARRALRDWAVFLLVFAAALTFRWSLIELEVPRGLTRSDSPYTDEGWHSISALNLVNDEAYDYSPVTHLTDRIHYSAPLFGLVNYLTLKHIGRGYKSRRYVAYGLTSLVFLGCALALMFEHRLSYGIAFLVLSAATLPPAYFFRLGIGHDLVLALMAGVYLLLTRFPASASRMAVAGALLGLLIATFLNGIFFVGACAAFFALQFLRARVVASSRHLVPWICFWSAFIGIALAAVLVWMLPHQVFAEPDVGRQLPTSLREIARNLGGTHFLPVRLHTPFLLSLFTVGVIAEIRRWRRLEDERLLLVLWALSNLAWVAILDYRPLRYFHFSIFPMVILASLWIGDLVTGKGAASSLRFRSTTLVGGLSTLVILGLAFVPRESSAFESVLVALRPEETRAVLPFLLVAVLGAFLLVVVLGATRWRGAWASALVVALVCGMVMLNLVQFANWIRRDAPYTERLEAELEAFVGRPAAVLVFNGPYVFNYLLRARGVIYSYEAKFEPAYASLKIGTILVPGGSGTEFSDFLSRNPKLSADLKFSSRVKGLPKLGHVDVYQALTEPAEPAGEPR